MLCDANFSFKQGYFSLFSYAFFILFIGILLAETLRDELHPVLVLGRDTSCYCLTTWPQGDPSLGLPALVPN